jgi:acetyltransferase
MAGEHPASGVAALLRPRSVAIVGARDRSGGWADRIRGNLRRFGYAGPVFAVNPRHANLWGEPCYPDLGSLPDPADHLVVLLPAPAAVEVLRGARRAGTRSATVFSSGFGGEPGGLLDQLRDIAAADGLAISGPNCLGNISVPASLVTTTDSRLAELREGPVAVVGQSGGIVTSFNRVLVDRGIGTRYVVSSGNETCLTTADYLRFFARDDGVRVALAFVESIRDRAAFFAACAEMILAGKHVVVLKAGQTPQSRQAAASHTGALAGSFAAFSAVAEQLGIVCVTNMDLAVEACEYLSRVAAPRGPGIAAVTVSGGVRELLLDGAARQGATLAALGDDTHRRLREVLGDGIEISNPLDSGYAGLSDPATLVRCVEAMAADPAVGVVLLQEELLGRPEPGKERTLRLFDSRFPGGVVGGGGTPVALFSMASVNVTEHGRSLRGRLGNLAFLQGTDRALGAVTTIARAARDTGPSRLPPGRPVGPGVAERRTLATELLSAAGADRLTEPAAKSLLRAYGLWTPREEQAGTPEEAAGAASRLTAPYVVKLVSADFGHKSDVGGVLLGLATPDDVRDACADITARHGAGAGFLVAEQVPAGVELVVGFVRDPEVGPVVMVGSGGVGVELFGDVAFAPAPCSHDTALAALKRTRAATLLGAWRGRPACDLDAVLDTICAMGQLATELGDLLSAAEINPLVALPGRSGALALDALAVGRPAGEAAQ